MKPKSILKSVGFTLLELLVAMALATVIMTLVYQVWTQSDSRRTQLNEEAALQENARTALHLLGGFIQKAGYFDWHSRFATNGLTSNNESKTPATLLTKMQAESLTALQAEFGSAQHSFTHFSASTEPQFQASSDKQAIEIRYLEGGFDCLRQSTPNAEVTTLQFFLKNSANISNLYCINLAKGQPQPIVEGVEELRFSFLEGTIWRSTPQNPARVSAVHVCMVLSSHSHRSAGTALLQAQRPTCALNSNGTLNHPSDYAPDLARSSKDQRRWTRMASIVYLPNNYLLNPP